MKNERRKWVLVAGTIAVIVLLGGLWAWRACIHVEKARVITEKERYRVGVTITATLNFENEIYQWGEYAWSIQRQENDSWVTILRRGDRYFFCSNMPECEHINLDEVERCPPLVFCEEPQWYKVQGQPEMIWDQSYKVAEKTFQCESGETGKVENRTCVVFDQVQPGIYKIRFEYALTIDQDDPFNREIEIKYAEKEIVIE